MKSASPGMNATRQDSIRYFADKKTRSFGGAACATSCQVDILSSVRNATGFTYFMTAYRAFARSGRRASISCQFLSALPRPQAEPYANECQFGSVRGHQATGVPLAIANEQPTTLALPP